MFDVLQIEIAKVVNATKEIPLFTNGFDNRKFFGSNPEKKSLSPLSNGIPKFKSLEIQGEQKPMETDVSTKNALDKGENNLEGVPDSKDLPETQQNDVPEKTENAESEKTAEGEKVKEGLTDSERQQIADETGWSDEIINHIDSMEQYEKVYKDAGLHEENIDGKPCLVKDIDWDYVDPKTGMTNRELAAKGRSPIDSKTGERIELHHMGQDRNGPFVELAENSEHGDGNHSILHPNSSESWRHEEGAKSQYNQERTNHWKTRAEGAN